MSRTNGIEGWNIQTEKTDGTEQLFSKIQIVPRILARQETEMSVISLQTQKKHLPDLAQLPPNFRERMETEMTSKTDNDRGDSETAKVDSTKTVLVTRRSQEEQEETVGDVVIVGAEVNLPLEEKIPVILTDEEGKSQTWEEKNKKLTFKDEEQNKKNMTLMEEEKMHDLEEDKKITKEKKKTLEEDKSLELAVNKRRALEDEKRNPLEEESPTTTEKNLYLEDDSVRCDDDSSMAEGLSSSSRRARKRLAQITPPLGEDKSKSQVVESVEIVEIVEIVERVEIVIVLISMAITLMDM